MTTISRCIDLSSMSNKKITIWHSNDMYVWIQGMLWGDDNRRTQFIPAKLFGLVAITSQDVGWGCVPVSKGYLVYRPCSVEFSYGREVSVKLVGIDTEKMQEWYKTFRPWVHIRLPRR